MVHACIIIKFHAQKCIVIQCGTEMCYDTMWCMMNYDTMRCIEVFYDTMWAWMYYDTVWCTEVYSDTMLGMHVL